MDLRISLSYDVVSSRAVLRATGTLDLASKEAFIDAGMDALSSGRLLALDLSAVDFMDSAGVAALVALSLAAEREWKTFELVGVSTRVRRVLELTGLADRWALPLT